MIKKTDLKLIQPSNNILHTPPEAFNFSGEIDSVMLSNIMYDRMKELGGVGLSANQVGLNIKMFVMGAGTVRMDVFNPEIVSVSSEEISYDEGCLSFPGVYIKVKRPESCVVRYQNNKGETLTQELTGLTARIFLHEFDHMEGKTFKDKVSKLKWDLAYNRMIKRTKKIIRKHTQKQLVDIANQIKEKNG